MNDGNAWKDNDSFRHMVLHLQKGFQTNNPGPTDPLAIKFPISMLFLYPRLRRPKSSVCKGHSRHLDVPRIVRTAHQVCLDNEIGSEMPVLCS